MNSSEDLVISTLPATSLVVTSEIMSTGTAFARPGIVTHKVSAWMRSLKVVALGMELTGTPLGRRWSSHVSHL